jgi:hypothetical protein
MRASSVVAAVLLLWAVPAVAMGNGAGQPPGNPSETAVAADAGAPPQSVEKAGYIMLVGTGQSKKLILKDETGESTALEGAPCSELGRALHLGVKVTGRLDPGGRMTVEDYEITDAGHGVKPLAGMLEQADGKLLLRPKNGGDPVELTGRSGVMAKLRAASGHKAWVTGNLKDGVLRVKTYGILDGK